ncbi:MAG TPA: aminotransferase class I/II-fold pyridoxal phosphate-dependent enzyme [Pseudomonadales bacterium]|nr:aminotransferase class I/II-fold pyridoxal phosphate-dependent enzyme [Pseudomonadales bacterium]
MTALTQRTTEQLKARLRELDARLDQLKAAGLSLDLTRGKPAADQLDLSNALDGILRGDYRLKDGTDARNYGGLLGIPEARALGAQMLDTTPDRVIAGGNSSLALMQLVVDAALRVGLWGAGSAWQRETHTKVRFVCPVPGYDRHFAICESLDIEMIAVPMTEHGPDMDAVEARLAADPSIKGIWCVPKYSNPTGCVYSDAVVARIAQLPKRAAAHFLVMWDNAYAVHDLEQPSPKLANIAPLSIAAGTDDNIVQFTSTSKITFAGAGVAFLSSSPVVVKSLEKHMSTMTIGPDKINQLRHVRFLEGRIAQHMQQHAALIRPKFQAVLERLDQSLGELGVATWTHPKGGYFISLDTLPGIAQRVVARARAIGVTLTPAGATFPYGVDPNDSNIRIAPTYPRLADVEAATDVFVLCVELESIEQILARRLAS